jgi:hypothetical protein
MDDVLVIAGSDDPVIVDLAAFVCRRGGRKVALVSTTAVCRQVAAPATVHLIEGFVPATFLSSCAGHRVSAVVLVLGRRAARTEGAVLDAVAAITEATRPECVCIVSSFRVHFGDQRAAQAEAQALERLKPLAGRMILFRASTIRSPHSQAAARLRAWSYCHPLIPERFTGCCIAGDELFAAIEEELAKPRPRYAVAYTLLGPNRAWRAWLRDHHADGLLPRCLAAVASLLAVLFVGRIAGLFVTLCARRPHCWDFDTLYPQSTGELLALYNRYNYHHVKIVGYNTGVVHFGHRYPARTMVSTVRCNQVARINGRVARFDSGVTIRQATDTLAAAGKELYVIPNYSYVSLGTAFFIPIHGSASEYSTLGDTIERVLLYDPVEDCFLRAARSAPTFREHMYNAGSRVLLLRLHVRVKAKSQYYRKHYRLENPTSRDILDAFKDSSAANVEIRKSRADDRSVSVSKYYTEPPPEETEALAFPRDSLGRLWDRLEANPISAALFHGFVRRFACHVELFLTPGEFAVFWETHRSLPVSKIQLRYIRRDDLPQSPFRRHDCISADLFMLRKHRQLFEVYMRENFREAQFNPGKHSL